MPHVLKPPTPIDWDDVLGIGPSVFLAGSIEQGAAIDWQARATAAFPEDSVIVNPRRDDWDWTWKQSIDNPKFREQVEWELEGLDNVDWVLLHFEPSTKSPISLLEFGRLSLLQTTGLPGPQLVVSCPEGFWRKGNVDIVCARDGVPRFDNIDEAIAHVVENL